MKIFRLRSLDEYKTHVEHNRKNHAYMNEFESQISKTGKKEFTVKGISYPANQFVNFKVDYECSDGVHINWRERLICPITLLNNRLRCSVHLLDIEVGAYPDSHMYISEQVTPLFEHLKLKFPGLIGSEYFGNDRQSGSIENGIRHEDMTSLSFENDSLDHYLSFECLEHIPDYKKAIAEMHRTLKNGGIFLGSFPFGCNSDKNLKRAELDANGKVIFLLEPEYHGQPNSEKGILCFTHFGWEVLSQFRDAGFSDAYAIFVWSDIFGYLGGEQIFFVAKK